MKNVLFESWDGICKIIFTTVSAYFLVFILLRVSGKRTLAKMNAFDFIVTIALGSILGSVILNKSIPLLEGFCAIAVLIFLQFCITFISVRNKSFNNFVSSCPTILFYNGEILYPILKKERITLGDIQKSIREAGFSSFSFVESIVLESNGDITVISKNESRNQNAMSDVKNIKF
ncbi:DUF421 domain-containing protein [Halpernia frigidisoli]|uniref:DUF421 domain-containing protein n=1 Tax=Halpernia frigidisoli TaxID=1125876 RepID=A0A1I3D129_9FLAO|nr:YetF domain-containing protein [Halpernia frigidisoli]SFH80413.1 Protein of unknown function [Halpernia frigidisoli]